MVSSVATGTSSEMTALAQPNPAPVPGGLLSRVQSLTWVSEAVPAKPGDQEQDDGEDQASARSVRV